MCNQPLPAVTEQCDFQSGDLFFWLAVRREEKWDLGQFGGMASSMTSLICVTLPLLTCPLVLRPCCTPMTSVWGRGAQELCSL